MKKSFVKLLARKGLSFFVVVSSLVVIMTVVTYYEIPSLVMRWSPWPYFVIIKTSRSIPYSERFEFDYRFTRWGEKALPDTLAILRNGDVIEREEAIRILNIIREVDPEIRYDREANSTMTKIFINGPWFIRSDSFKWILLYGDNINQENALKYLKNCKDIDFDFRQNVLKGLPDMGLTEIMQQRVRDLIEIRAQRTISTKSGSPRL